MIINSEYKLETPPQVNNENTPLRINPQPRLKFQQHKEYNDNITHLYFYLPLCYIITTK